MPYFRIGWLLAGLSGLLLLVSLPEGPQQGYILLTMMVTLTFAVIFLAAAWLEGGR